MTTLHAQLGLNSLTNAELAARGHTLSAGLAANSTLYPHPPVDPATLAASADDLIAKEAAKAQHDAEGIAITAAVNTARTKLHHEITGDTKYAETLAAGDEAKLRLAGLTPQPKAVRHTDLPTPAGLAASLGDVLGEVDLHWHASRSSAVISARVEMTPDATKPELFHQVATTSKSKVTISGLTHGATLTFRVVFLGTDDKESTPSGSVTIVV